MRKSLALLIVVIAVSGLSWFPWFAHSTPSADAETVAITREKAIHVGRDLAKNPNGEVTTWVRSSGVDFRCEHIDSDPFGVAVVCEGTVLWSGETKNAHCRGYPFH